MIPQKDLQKQLAMFTELTTQWEFAKAQFPYLYRSICPRSWLPYCLSGEIGRSIRINSQDLADFVNAEFADIKE